MRGEVVAKSICRSPADRLAEVSAVDSDGLSPEGHRHKSRSEQDQVAAAITGKGVVDEEPDYLGVRDLQGHPGKHQAEKHQDAPSLGREVARKELGVV